MQGFVYILVSPNSSYIKIGGTERPISQRLRAINGTEAYAGHGPWELSDFLHVSDWRLVEGAMHKHFSKDNIRDVEGTRELFGVAPHTARNRLKETDVALRVGHEKTRKIFQHADLKLFLFRLFQLSGLYGSLDLQGAWTLSILPKTNGGRWFTLNIGPHEVAFTTFKAADGKFEHYIILDRLILEYPETIIWVGKRDGVVQEAAYASARRAVIVSFWDNFASAERFFALPGVRRALIAYWSESLADLRERNANSVYARYHSYDAVSELIDYKYSTERVFALAAKPFRK